MPLTLAEKGNILRHMRYPVQGLYRTGVSGATMAGATSTSFRYLQAYGMVLWRLNNLMAVEEARLTGAATASIAFLGPTPNIGDTLTVTFSGGTLVTPVSVVLTVTPELITSADSFTQQYGNANIGLAFCSALAALVLGNPTLMSAGFNASAPYGVGPYSQVAIPVPEIQFTNSTTFNISVATTGLMSAQIMANGEILTPSIQPGTVNPIYGYLPICDYLENAYGSASETLMVRKADVFTRNSAELADRFSLYQMWCKRLAEFLDIPMNEQHRTNFRSSTPRAYL